MAVPKRRHSNSRTRMRRAHDATPLRHVQVCPHCSGPVPPHTICPKCGHYMGRKIVDIEP